MWATWHLPLLSTEGRTLYGQPFWVLILDLGAKAILFTWVFLRTRGSVLIAVLLHAANNVFSVSPVVSETGSLSLPLIAVGLQWVLAILVLVAGRPRFGRIVTDPEVVWPAEVPAGPTNQATSGPTAAADSDYQPR